MKIKITLCFIFFSLSGACFSKENYKTSESEIICGKIKVAVSSACMKGEDDESLNICKPQIIKITNGASARKATLPELDKRQVELIKKSDGTISDLFAIKMGCAVVDNGHYAIIYYSIGGGSAPYSEAWTTYDEQGRLLSRNILPLYGQQFDAMYKKMKKIKSIMPENLSAAPMNANKKFEVVFNALAAKNVLNSGLRELIDGINFGCHSSIKPVREQYKTGNFECEDSTDIVRLFVSGRTGDGIGSVTADISGIDKCPYIATVLRKNFGRPTKAAGECELIWDLKPTKKGSGRRIVNMEESKDKNLIYFSIEEEVGP